MSALFKSQRTPLHQHADVRRCLSQASPDVLRRWKDPGVELALWERSWDRDVSARLDRLTAEAMPGARFIARTCDVEASVAAGLQGAVCSDEMVLAALAMDIEALVARYGEATGSMSVEVRLEVIRGDACRLFHVDRTRSRLVTTYVGPGTEWVPAVHAQEALRKPSGYDGPILRVPRFGVAVFPGSLARGGGLVHRSPAIAGTGQVRLFLCMTEASP